MEGGFEIEWVGRELGENLDGGGRGNMIKVHSINILIKK